MRKNDASAAVSAWALISRLPILGSSAHGEIRHVISKAEAEKAFAKGSVSQSVAVANEGPPVIDGKKCEDYWRSHQVPMGNMHKPEHIRILEQWMKSYRPEELTARPSRWPRRQVRKTSFSSA